MEREGRSALASNRGRRDPSLTHSTLDLPDKTWWEDRHILGKEDN